MALAGEIVARPSFPREVAEIEIPAGRVTTVAESPDDRTTAGTPFPPSRARG
jgi:hypothetical protein